MSDRRVLDDGVGTDPDSASADGAVESGPADLAEAVSPRRRGEHLDRLAGLEEERRFLLRSLDDLEREFDAGDVDEADYRTLKDGYTVRAAAVLRQIESGRTRLAARPARPPRNWARTAVITAVVLVVALAIGFALASAFGERGAGQEITGGTPGDDARVVLASARDALNAGNLDVANSLFGRVVQAERERGVDNAEAITYFGWTLALRSVQEPDAAVRSDRLDASKLAMAQAIEIDPTYADPHCFLAIIEFNFFDDAERALAAVERCEENDPPADLRELIAGFADEIRAAV